MKIQYSISLLLPLLFAFLGCGDSGKVPARFPCQVHIVSQGENIEGLQVLLTPVSGASELVVRGITDGHGMARPDTLFGTKSFKGVPEGEYRVQVNFSPVFKEKSKEELQKMTMEESKAYAKEVQKKMSQAKNIVPPILNGATSPLTVTVSASGENSLDVELNEYAKK